MVNWSDAVDLKRAAQNIHLEYPGDWYRDPWGWPEIDWLVERRPDQVIARLNASGARRPAKIDVAKENFGVRPAVVLDPADRLAYQALIDALSVDLIGNLPRSVYGWRLQADDPTPGEFSRQDYQWENYNLALGWLSLRYVAALKTDIVSCFASVPVDRLAERIEQRRNNDLSQRLISMVLALGGIVPGRSGLSQRSFASAALANLYMTPLDEVVAEYSDSNEVYDFSSLRWMDDIWIFGDDEGVLRRAEVELQKAMAALGLDMNIAKTEVLVDDDVETAVKNMQHSAVDQDLFGDATGLPLNELIDALLRHPETASRTSVKFATTRMREHERYERVDDFASNAARMPHASDALARLFRDSDHWRTLDDWYPAYLKSGWSAIDWSGAQFGTMYPSRDKVPDVLIDTFSVTLAAGPSLALTALLAQRLAAWNPSMARAAIRAAIDRVGHPLQRRALGLAAIAAGEERDMIRKVLGEFEETSLTLLMLDDRGWDIPVKSDFEGG